MNKHNTEEEKLRKKNVNLFCYIQNIILKNNTILLFHRNDQV